jgi:hypothetical protein
LVKYPVYNHGSMNPLVGYTTNGPKAIHNMAAGSATIRLRAQVAGPLKSSSFGR